MRLNDAPEHECPECEEHPVLVYEDSVGPMGTSGPSGRVENGITVHFYTCATCGGHYRAVGSGKPTLSSQHSGRNVPEKKCPDCGAAMRVKDCYGPVPLSGPRTFGGNYNRVETTLICQCTACPMTDEFRHAGVLGFN